MCVSVGSCPRGKLYRYDSTCTVDTILSTLVYYTCICSRLIINDCLDSGTQLPFIHRAAREGYGVMVLNGNLNHVRREKKEVPIPVSTILRTIKQHFVQDSSVLNYILSLVFTLVVLTIL